MTVADITINPIILKRFTTLTQKGRLAHSYLFVGPADSGKGETALAVAKLVNCERNLKGDMESFCDQCPSCMKINSGNHLDVHTIESGIDEPIKIEQVRDVLDQVKLRPFEARYKVFIIKNIENMTLEGANAILKTLEEPTPSSLLLLTTKALEKNLDTVRSRCHIVPMLSLSKEEIFGQLKKSPQSDDLQSYFYAFFAQGCLGKAKELEKDEFFTRKNEFIDQFVFAHEVESFMKKILEDKQTTKEFLDILLSWVRDALLLKQGIEEYLIHRDRLKDLKQFELHFSFDELKDSYGEITKTYQLLADNLNLKIPLLIIKERLSWAK